MKLECSTVVDLQTSHTVALLLHRPEVDDGTESVLLLSGTLVEL